MRRRGQLLSRRLRRHPPAQEFFLAGRYVDDVLMVCALDTAAGGEQPQFPAFTGSKQAR
jgi:hypothetical protein